MVLKLNLKFQLNTHFKKTKQRKIKSFFWFTHINSQKKSKKKEILKL